jgi:hypothetical protein
VHDALSSADRDSLHATDAMARLQMADAHDCMVATAFTVVQTAVASVNAAQLAANRLRDMPPPSVPRLDYVLEACPDLVESLSRRVLDSSPSLKACRFRNGIQWLEEKNLEEILLWLCNNGAHSEKVMAGAMLDFYNTLEVTAPCVCAASD